MDLYIMKGVDRLTAKTRHEQVQAGLLGTDGVTSRMSCAEIVGRLASGNRPELAVKFLFGLGVGEDDDFCHRDGFGYTHYAALCSPGSIRVVSSIAAYHHWSASSEGCIWPGDGTPVLSFEVYPGEWLIVEEPAVAELLSLAQTS